jgi:glycosyltransferase involved in cell wall biosynthesis
MLSIIIPTLNEEKNITRLLKQITDQEIGDMYEILIADAGSKDKTCEIAKNFGARVVPGGLPAVGRNSGAKYAKGDILLFLDADLKLSPDLIKKTLAEFKERHLDVASYALYPQINNLLLNKLTLNIFYNYPARVLRKIFPMGAMGIMVNKHIFEQIGGFDEKISLAEDHYFISQAAMIGNFGLFREGTIYMPTRRFEKDGYIRTSLKYLQCAIHMKVYGRKGMEKFKYEFDHYDEPKKSHKKAKKKDLEGE